MTQKEINELKARVYSISNCMFPLDAFLNDIEQNKNQNYNKEGAYNDLKLITDVIYELKEKLKEKEQDYTLEEVKQLWEALGYICVCDSENELIFEEEQSIPFYDFYCNRVHILKKWKLYDVVTITKKNNKRKEIRLLLNFEIHQLLTKTFKALGW